MNKSLDVSLADEVSRVLLDILRYTEMFLLQLIGLWIVVGTFAREILGLFFPWTGGSNVESTL